MIISATAVQTLCLPNVDTTGRLATTRSTTTDSYSRDIESLHSSQPAGNNCTAIVMGLLTIIRKSRQKEKKIRILFL